MRRLFILPLALSLVLSGCETLNKVTEMGTSLGVAAGAINEDQAQSINKSVGAVGKVFESITPEQEYYIGRTVAATILTQNKPFDQKAMTTYLNTLGQYLALCSDRPETFIGYHFLIMDTSDINAFAAPGGFILVSRGMLRCCKSEEALAGVLAHEIGHVELNHGLQAIDKSRLTAAATILGTEAAKNLGGKDLADLTKTFENSIADITSTVMNSGYARKFEFQADKAAVTILERSGYSPSGLVSLLQQMEKNLKPGGHDFAKTHPAPQDRINELTRIIKFSNSPSASSARLARFAAAMQGI
ncbi:MAG: M48 family metallopeptidase [bacterium]